VEVRDNEIKRCIDMNVQYVCKTSFKNSQPLRKNCLETFGANFFDSHCSSYKVLMLNLDFMADSCKCQIKKITLILRDYIARIL